jgi:transposase
LLLRGKGEVALAAIRGEKTVSELVSQHEIHSALVNNWKRQLSEQAGDLFESAAESKGTPDQQAQIDELYRQIGQLKVERFLIF